jgi:Glycosyl transferase family 2
MLSLAIIALCLSALACFTFVANMRLYLPVTPLASSGNESPDRISVLIPARNEELNIAAALESVCADNSASLEIIVGDDHSEDRTAEIVREFAARDERVRLLSIPSPPVGWNGKQHVCSVLAQAATGNVLLFVDADVTLAPSAIPRMAGFLRQSGAQLISGVPRQICGTFMERLVLPLIHFLLLAYLPMQRMRNSAHPSYAAGCGQLFMADKMGYRKAGGHAAIWNSMHDGINLPRAFRTAGLKSDLFDATDVASCRMYVGAEQVWEGLAKNAVEAMANPRLIGVFTALLLGGQVLPFVTLPAGLFLHRITVVVVSAVAMILALVPRFFGVQRFRQPLVTAVLHPFGVVTLLMIQWHALIRHMVRTPATWKGRSYTTAKVKAAKPVAG